MSSNIILVFLFLALENPMKRLKSKLKRENDIIKEEEDFKITNTADNKEKIYVANVKKEVKTEEIEKDFHSKSVTYRNLRIKKPVVYRDEDSNSSEDFKKIEREYKQVAPIKLTIKKEVGGVPAKTKKIKPEIKMDWQIDHPYKSSLNYTDPQPTSYKRKETIHSSTNLNNYKMKVKNLDSGSIDKSSIQPPTSSIQPPKIKPNILSPISRERLQMQLTQSNVSSDKTVKSDDFRQKELSIIKSFSILKVSDGAATVTDSVTHSKAQTTHYKAVDDNKMHKNIQNTEVLSTGITSNETFASKQNVIAAAKKDVDVATKKDIVDTTIKNTKNDVVDTNAKKNVVDASITKYVGVTTKKDVNTTAEKTAVDGSAKKNIVDAITKNNVATKKNAIGATTQGFGVQAFTKGHTGSEATTEIDRNAVATEEVIYVY